MALPDSATLSDTYGGPYTNADPVQDPTTEVNDDEFNEALADIAACTRMVGRAWVSFIGVTYTSGTQSIATEDHDAVWGASGAVEPVVTQTATGIYTVTWPATVDDELGNTKTLNIRVPLEPWTIDTALSRAKCSAKTANTMTVRTFNAAGAANALNGILIYATWI